MRTLKHTLFASGLLSLCAASFAQPPEEDRGPRGGDEGGPRPEARERERERERDEDRDRSSFIDRLMARDTNGDKKLTKEELLDSRLSRLFDRADADHDGSVTSDELSALERSEEETYGRGGPRDRGPGDFGPRGFGPPEGGPPRDGARPPREGDRPRPEGNRDGDRPEGDRGPRDGERGPRDVGGPPRGDRPEGPRGFGPPFGMRGPGMMGPGMILPPPLVEELDLSQEQREKLRELQRDVQARLQDILTEEQRDKLREMRERGPGGPGPRGFGPDGPRRDGDRPDDRDRPRDGGDEDRPRPDRD